MENHTHQAHAPIPYQQPRPQQQEYPQQNYSPAPNQAQQTSPQQPYPPVPNQPHPTYHNQPTHQPQQQYQPPQQYQTQQPYPQQQAYAPSPIPHQAAPKKKSHAISIASFVLTGIAYLPTISLIIYGYAGDYDFISRNGLGLIHVMLLMLYVPPVILLSVILAIIGLSANKTKSALIALLVAVIATALIYIWFFYFYP